MNYSIVKIVLSDEKFHSKFKNVTLNFGILLE